MEAPVTRSRLFAVLALALAIPAAAEEMTGKEKVLWEKLRARIEAVDRGLDGLLGVSLRDHKSGATIELRADELFPTASTIKLAILYELFRQADERRLDLAAVTHPPLPRVGGGGILESLGGNVALTWRDLSVLMIGWSDNEAANLLAGKVGMEAVNRRLDALGLTRTRLRRRMMDLQAAREGRENVATPAELARLAEAVARGTGLTAERAQDLRAVAATPESHSAFRAALPEGSIAYTKSGELEAVRCEVGYVDLPGRPYTAAVMTTYLRRDKDGEAAIRDVSAAIYETMARLAGASDLGRVISEK